MLAVVFVFDLHKSQLGVALPYLVPHWLVALLVFALVSFFSDYAWRISTHRTPPYKRQFAIFGMLVLTISIRDLYARQSADMAYAYTSLMCVFGAAAGLIASGLPLVIGSRDPSHGWWRGANRRPNPSRPLIIVADSHWRCNLTGLQEATCAMPDADWLFIGDVFDVWVGISGFETDPQRSFIWWVSERRRTCHWVGLWLGNREYFFDDMASKFDFIGEGTGGMLEGEPFVFEHGDLINTKDRQYRLWSFLSRSAPVWLLANLIPSSTGTKLMAFIEKKLQTTNKGNKSNFPRAEFQRAIHDSKAEFFISGHFHTPEEADKGLSVPWAHEGIFLLWRNRGFSVFRPQMTDDWSTDKPNLT